MNNKCMYLLFNSIIIMLMIHHNKLVAKSNFILCTYASRTCLHPLCVHHFACRALSFRGWYASFVLDCIQRPRWLSRGYAPPNLYHVCLLTGPSTSRALPIAGCATLVMKMRWMIGTIVCDLNHDSPHKLKAKARFWDSILGVNLWSKIKWGIRAMVVNNS